MWKFEKTLNSEKPELPSWNLTCPPFIGWRGVSTNVEIKVVEKHFSELTQGVKKKFKTESFVVCKYVNQAWLTFIRSSKLFWEWVWDDLSPKRWKQIQITQNCSTPPKISRLCTLYHHSCFQILNLKGWQSLVPDTCLKEVLWMFLSFFLLKNRRSQFPRA